LEKYKLPGIGQIMADFIHTEGEALYSESCKLINYILIITTENMEPHYYEI
jgi:hypothetical protein